MGVKSTNNFPRNPLRRLIAGCAALSLICFSGLAASPTGSRPQILSDVGIDQKLDAEVPPRPDVPR